MQKASQLHSKKRRLPRGADLYAAQPILQLLRGSQTHPQLYAIRGRVIRAKKNTHGVYMAENTPIHFGDNVDTVLFLITLILER